VLPDRWQHFDGIKYSAEISEWCQHKSRDDGDVIKTATIDCVDKTSEREQRRSEHKHRKTDCEMMNA